jgi:polyisoprenoid-binding protein YceI
MPEATYQLDGAHSSARFSVRHLMIAHVHGSFSGLTGTLVLDTDTPASSTVSVEIDVDSLSTGQPDRDTHLKSADFFDAAQYPKITFVSTDVEITESGGKVSGNLTVHGVTKAVTLNVDGNTDEIKDPWGNLRVGFTAATKIKRSDFGLTWNAALETGGVAVSDEVNVTLEVQFVKQAA